MQKIWNRSSYWTHASDVEFDDGLTLDEKISFTGRIKDLMVQLPHNFIQIHQSFIINMSHMNECSYENVKMRGNIILNISQPYRKLVRKHIMDCAWGRND